MPCGSDVPPPSPESEFAMRASTLFAVILSLLIGLGAAAGARHFGLFDKPTTPPPEPVVVVKEAPTKVLVSGANLFEGVYVTANQVKVRELRPDEKEFYNANKS